MSKRSVSSIAFITLLDIYFLVKIVILEITFFTDADRFEVSAKDLIND